MKIRTKIVLRTCIVIAHPMEMGVKFRAALCSKWIPIEEATLDQ
jgi:hypothetical protein